MDFIVSEGDTLASKKALTVRLAGMWFTDLPSTYELTN